MIEHKKYIIFDIDKNAKDSLLLADLKAYGYKMANLPDEQRESGETLSKADEIHECLNQLFHYKGHKKSQVVVISDKEETLKAAEELEITVIAEVSPNALRELLIDEAELQAKRAKAAKDGPTAVYRKATSANGQPRQNPMAVVWKFLYPFLLFYFSKQFLVDFFGPLVLSLAEANEELRAFLIDVGQSTEEATYASVNGNAVIQSLTMITTFFVVYFLIGGKATLNKAKKEAHHFTAKDGAIFAILCLVLAIGLNGFFAGVGFLEADEAYKQVANTLYAVGIPMGIILYGVCAPLTEELIFRGVIFGGMKELSTPLFSAVISSVLFGMYHGNTVQALYGFAISMIFAYAYHYSGRLVVPVFLHGLLNVVVFLLSKAGIFTKNVVLTIVGVVCTLLSAAALYYVIKTKEREQNGTNHQN